MANLEKEFSDRIEMLEDLATKQNKALGISKHLHDLKDKLIEVCEAETEYYKQEYKRLRRALIICCVSFALISILNLIRLLV